MLILKVMLGFSTLAALPSTALAVCSTDHVGDPDYPYKYYHLKTRYDTVRGDITQEKRPEGCTPRTIVIYARHGARHPGAYEEGIFNDLFELASKVNSTGKATLCQDDLEKIRNWVNWHQPEMDMELATTGYVEMEEMGKRFSKAFPELFTSENTHRFISSPSQRCIDSSIAFGKSFTDGTPTIEISDILLRYLSLCDRYSQDVSNNEHAHDEVNKYLAGPRIAKVVKDVRARLGLSEDDASAELIKHAYQEGCTEEEWANDWDSAWCLAFTKEEKQAYEYGIDIDEYAIRSYLHEINYRPSCVAKQFILSALKNESLNIGNPTSGYFLDGHITSTTPLFTEMKIFEDDGLLTGENYDENVDRALRLSFLGPSGANLAIVLYSCGDNNDMKLQFFLNEKPLRMPIDDANAGELWDLEDALQYYGFYNLDDCNYDQICSV